MAVRAASDQVYLVLSTAVDAAFYRAAYGEAAADPVTDYIDAGWREGRDPAPWFSTADYLAANPDVGAAGMNPLFHYLTLGQREGRAVSPSEKGRAYLMASVREGREAAWRPQLPALPSEEGPVEAAAPSDAAPPDERALVATEFDADYYVAVHPDVAGAGADPLDHFLTFGWREGRDPNVRFSVVDYLEANPDVREAGLNPFYHYLLAGRAEGRSPKHELGFRFEVISHLRTLDERNAAPARAARKLDPAPREGLEAALGVSRSGLRDLHLTFSHDDYTANLGGLQLCLRREAGRAAESGRDHLHLFPVQPFTIVRGADDPDLLGVVWNGEPAGVFRARDVAEALRAAARQAPPGRRSFAIHSLLGHRAEEVLEILRAVRLTQGFFWLHDFASVCSGFHLLRNDVQDCGAPPPDSPACGVCIYLPYRRRHLEAHGKLFDGLDLTVVAPSAAALATWKAGWAYDAAGEVIHPHARLIRRAAAPDEDEPQPEGPFRFAYLGFPAAHKGWPVFRELALRFADDPRYRFLHLGARSEPGVPCERCEVSVSEADPFAMQHAVERLQVDAAMIWSLCRETFSFTAHEAVAGGAAVVTGPDSGNVAAFVASGGHGRVLADEAALTRAFETGEILELARAARRPQLYDLEHSALTLDLVPEEIEA